MIKINLRSYEKSFLNLTGYHVGVKVGDKVYDNLTTEGMSYRRWLIDLGYRYEDGPRRVK